MFKRKSITVILLVAIIASLCVFPANAAESKVWDGTKADGFARGTGTEADPYIIETAEQLAYFSFTIDDGDNTFYNKHIKLANDIVLNDTSKADWKENAKAFDPIGSDKLTRLLVADAADFYATLEHYGTLYCEYSDADGRSYEKTTRYIEGMDIYAAPKVFAGTFDGCGYSIKGLYMDLDENHVGLFAINDGTIKNVGIVDSYISGNDYTGGIVGDSYGKVSGCYSINSEVHCLCHSGGIIGNGEAYNCYSLSDLHCKNYEGGLYVGGIVGQGSAENCYNAGDITSKGSTVGGVIGSGAAKHCYNVGKVSGNRYIGSVIGEAIYDVVQCYYLPDTATNGKGNAQNGIGEYHYNALHEDDLSNTAPLTAEQMKDSSHFKGFDFNSVWTMGKNEYKYPVLIANKSETPAAPVKPVEPEKPDEPVAPIEPEKPDEPIAPVEPDEPATPSDVPTAPDEPASPDTPIAPPDTPDVPIAPAPDAPDEPIAPAPDAPDEPTTSAPEDNNTPNATGDNDEKGGLPIWIIILLAVAVIFIIVILISIKKRK